MGHLDLIATDTQHYVALVSRLLQDDIFREQQSRTIENLFYSKLHKNQLVAEEWAIFFERLLK